MALSLISMFAAGTGGTEDGAASIDIPEDGTIVGVKWAVSADLDADQEEVAAELSFIQSGQLTTNDSRGIIDLVRIRMALTTSGVSTVSINQFTPMDLSVAGGERLYLNLLATASTVSSVNAMIHLLTRGAAPRRSRRRR